jgi:ABC-2 type transport system ATP-binding protein
MGLMHRPQVLFLDEPTTGLDPEARAAMWEELSRLAGVEKLTILLTTHYLEEAERLADRVAIIDRGRLLALGSPEALTRAEAAPEVHFSARPGLDVADLARSLAAPSVREERPGEYVLAADVTPALLADLAAWLRDRGTLITRLQVGHRSLEELFLQLTGREVRD